MASYDSATANQIQWQALGNQASTFTYCLINRTTEQIGTAIAIRLGKRFFFATARHVIENGRNIEVLLRGEMPEAISDFTDRHYHDHLDIGLLELAPADAPKFQFAKKDQLQTAIDMSDELPALVLGYPGQFTHLVEIPLNDESDLRVCRCDSLTFQTVLLPLCEWPRDGVLQEPLACDRDLIVSFQPEPRISQIPPGALITEVPSTDCDKLDPHGLSGGGIWLAQVEDRGGLWISDIRLIGIQTGWYERKGWLKGIRIEPWLDLVQSKYSDLDEGDSLS